MGRDRKGQVVGTEEVTNNACGKTEGKVKIILRLWVLTKAAGITRKEAWTIIQTIACMFHVLVIGLFSLGSFIRRRKKT